MKKFLTIAAISGCVALLSLTRAPRSRPTIGVDQTLAYFRTQSSQFAASCSDLQKRINDLQKNDPVNLSRAKQALRNCRLRYKNIEFFLNYFFPTIAIVYNAPPVPEAEEPYLEYRDPTGLQVIEQMLFSPNAFNQKKSMMDQASLIRSSAEDLNSLLYNLAVDDTQILESIRLNLIRVMTLGIVGFDAPELKSGITEAAQVFRSMQTILAPYLEKGSADAHSVSHYLNAAIEITTHNKDFNSFDRLAFLTTIGFPLGHHLNLLIKRDKLELNTTRSLNYDAENLFSPDAISINDRFNVSPEVAKLGKKLFFEKALSGNNLRSCATCHRPEKYFTDGLPKSFAMNGKSTVQRNAPSLLYSVFQYSQFWDGRVKTFDDQIYTVLTNPVEMDANDEIIIQRLKSDNNYRADFKKAFPNEKTQNPVNMNNIVSSLTTYLKTLTLFNSQFDRYVQGNRSALTKEEIRGFNLFTGKALCATCHTMPVFNGLMPPYYNTTSLEVVGTTANINFKKPQLDEDSGRYSTYHLAFYLRAFKTPGLRNVGKTAPYMHNGQFSGLESVLEFYNKGGGAGMGLNVSHQTLSSAPLKLNNTEIRDIIAFLNSLSDSLLIPEHKMASTH